MNYKIELIHEQLIQSETQNSATDDTNNENSIDEDKVHKLRSVS